MSCNHPPILKIVLEAISVVIPLVVLAEVFILGLFPTLWYILRHPRWIATPSQWPDSFLRTARSSLAAMGDKIFNDEKRKLLSLAKGRILEVGPGTGETVKYYDKSKVDIIYGVEPDLVSVVALNVQLMKHDMLESYKVLPFGVENKEMMNEAGVVAGSIDTIVCVLLLFQYH